MALGCIQSQASWHLTPDLNIQELYSSNIDLTVNPQSEWVTNISPSLTLDNRNQRNPMQAFYRAQGYHYVNNAREDRIYHQALLQANKNFLQNRVNFSASADHAQTVLFPSNQLTVDNIRGSNTTNVSRMVAGPRINHNLGSKLRADYRYQLGHVLYHQSVPNALTHDADMNISSIHQGRMTFDGKAHWDTTRQDSQSIGESFDSLVTVGYFISKKIRPYVAYGYEKHTNAPNLSSLDGPRWHAGLYYQPYKRVSFDGYWGERAFGDSYSFSGSWLKKNGVVSISYSEEVTNFFRAELSQLPTVTVNDLGLISIQFQPQIRDDVFVRKIARINWQTQAQKWVSSIQPYYELREVESQVSNEKGWGLNAELTWVKNPRFQVTALGGYSHQDLINQAKDERYQGGIRVFQQIKPKTHITYGYSHFELRRTNLSKISENTVSISIYYQPK